MKITQIQTQPNWVLSIVSDDGRQGRFDVSPYLTYEAFDPLRDPNEFAKVINGGYFIEWDCGADLMDNHHPKGPHIHLDNREIPYEYIDDEKLIKDFKSLVLENIGVKL